MKVRRIAIVAAVVMVLAALAWAVVSCEEETVTVTTGEIVLCTEGEIVSDTTESIEVRASEVADHAVRTRVVTCDLHAQLEELYGEAQDALAAGDMEAAERALAEVIALDPLYRKASAQLEDVRAGRTPVADGDAPPGTEGDVTPGSDAKPGDETPSGPVINLSVYTPDTLPGFVGQGLVADPFVLTRYYLPTGDGPMSSLVIVVEQFQDPAMAQRELDRVIKTTYPLGAADVAVSSATGYFGANRDVGIVAFIDGAVLVAVEGGPTSGESTALKGPLSDLAVDISR